jgi:asparagine synthase (glutamine-hydrolysing)
MCGIAGFVAVDPTIPDAARLHAAASQLRHRGPDASEIWTSGPVGLAHTRLAIIDRAGGAQPMRSEDGRFVVVFNGEIYNHHQLREELRSKGYIPRTRCDTEVLLSLYADRGPAMVDDLRGMFAFAIVDTVERRAFLARDRTGKKPLYYATGPTGLTFASTLDALLPLLPETPSLDHQAIAEYLVLQYVPASLTTWEGVRALEPGHRLTWSDRGVDVGRYWRPPLPRTGRASRDDQTSLVELRRRIRDAVMVRLESEVPLGVFLSGGLDSSVVVAEMAAEGIRPATFSIGFRDERFDESRFAAMVARRFGSDHRTLHVEADVRGLFSDLSRCYDEPFADSSALVTLAVARAASEHVTVVLTGDGGDELFGGYDRYRAHALATKIRRGLGPIAPPVARAMERLAGAVGFRRLAAAGSFIEDPWVRYRDRLFHFSPAEAAAILRPEVATKVDVHAPVARLDALWSEAETSRWVPWVDAQTYLPDDLLTKMDRATMAVGVEARAPLLDHELWSYVATLPRDRLLGPRRGKLILRDAYRNILPREILTRPKKGFGVPLEEWLRAELAPDVDDLLLAAGGPLHELMQPDRVAALVGRFRAGDGGAMYRVWNLLCLANWMRFRLERRPEISGAHTVFGRIDRDE